MAPVRLTMPPEKVVPPVTAMPLPSVSVITPLLVKPPKKVGAPLA